MQTKKRYRRAYEKDLPLLSTINNKIDGIIRWCTPSIHPAVPKARGIYDNDISISYHGLGNPSLNTGIFKEAYQKAAAAYGSDHTLFSVNGSSGSNFMVLRALKHQLGGVNMLLQRNVHKSISVAIEDFQIDATYLQPHYDNKLQIFIPNTTKEILDGLRENPRTNVLLITNPTYEGLSINLSGLVQEARKANPDLIIFVDEAWVAHFPFSKKLPPSAMESGADICVQSTHKQGSGLQQTGMIHWQGNRLSSKSMMDSYKSLLTTSPSFHLLASLDGTRYLMETKGGEIIDYLLEVSDLLRNGLDVLPGVEVVNPSKLKRQYDQIEFLDESKILVNIEQTGLTGYEIAHYLEKEYRVIVEKYEANNILFLTTFQNNKFEAKETVKSFRHSLQDLKNKKKSEKPSFPEFPTEIIKSVPSYEISKNKLKAAGLEDAAGKICAEDIVPYPPGIPLIAKGEEIQKEHINYLKALKNTSGLISVVMNDYNMRTVLTVDTS